MIKHVISHVQCVISHPAIHAITIMVMFYMMPDLITDSIETIVAIFISLLDLVIITVTFYVICMFVGIMAVVITAWVIMPKK